MCNLVMDFFNSILHGMVKAMMKLKQSFEYWMANCRLDRAIQTFELRPAYEDVLKPETASVQDYLRRVHETIAASIVQEAHKSAVSSFEDHMDAYIAASWSREKRMLLDSVEPFSAPISVSNGTPGRSKTFMASSKPDGGAMLRGRAAKYANIVRKINSSLATGQKYEAIGDFLAAAAAEDRGSVGSDTRTTILRVWQVLKSQLQSQLYDLPPSAQTQRSLLLLNGSRSYLEDNFVAYMQNVVNTHRAQAALGGNPSRLALVQGFLRVKERERGILDFDQGPGGLDTSWLQVYVCLRAGFVSEAIEVAKSTSIDSSSLRPAALSFTPGTKKSGHSSSALSSMLMAWAEGGSCPLTGEQGSIATSECERLLRDREARAASPHFPHRAMVYALLAGSNRTADSLARDYPSIFPTIEDYLWLKLGLIRLEPRSAGLASSGLESYSLKDFQKSLRQYPPSHYSHKGREPLLYAIVLLLSLQSTAAVDYLSRDPSTRDVRLDAVHIGACLWHAHAIVPCGEDATYLEGSKVTDISKESIGSLIHQYGHSLIHGDVKLALEYYMLAASALGGSLGVRGALLKELLSESKAYGLLLGSGGTGSEGGELASLIPDPEERRQVLEAVAAECASAGQMEESAELYMAANRPRAALVLLTERLSEEIEGAASSAQKSEEADALAARAQAAADAMKGSQDSSDISAIESFEQVKIIRIMLAAAIRGDKSRVLQALGELDFVPIDQYRFQRCVVGVSSLSRAVANRIQAILLAAAEALAAAGKRDELRTVVAFAAAVPNRVSQAAYQRLNQWNVSLS